ncbi:hypothetical protein PHMEG_00011767 [Phytophthora megakarya]|uniref:Uncharacterized protein n=1 Tax=Phytophthora megakarya TaxID=4795 RepID=A0A225WAY4_9STRA|nr:hypothetical protein PHMEG_00011767 [Phytophthora megakarya]
MYRFVITSDADKMKITLEDLTSKIQWSTGFLDGKEYLTSTNKIPNASLADYITMFKDTLEYRTDTSKDNEDNFVVKDEPSTEDNSSSQEDIQPLDPRRIRRKLTPLEDDIFQLELFVKIRIFQSAWTAKYMFEMEPVVLDRVDILEAKLRDVEDELVTTKKILEEEKRERVKVEDNLNEVVTKVEEMKEDLSNVKQAKPFIYIHGISENVQQLKEKGLLRWTSVEGNAFVSSSDGAGMRALLAGWYAFNLTVYLTPQNLDTTVEILNNAEYLQSKPIPNVEKREVTITFSFMAYIKKNDELTVVASSSPLCIGAYIDAFKIGN